MTFLRRKFEASAALARVVPFAVFLALTFCQGRFGDAARYWFYLAKTLVGAWLIWEMRPFVVEMRWKVSWEALAVGIAVFVMWVGIDDFYPKLRRCLSDLKRDARAPEKMLENEKAKQLTRDIVSSRLRKIVSMASAPAQTEQTLKNLTAEERFLYDKLYTLVNEWRMHVSRCDEAAELE